MPRRNYRAESQKAKNIKTEEKEIKMEKNDIPQFPEPVRVTRSPKQRLFISLPMRGRNVDDIRQDLKKLYKPLKENYELIDTIWPETNEAENNQTWYLGKSIQALGTADLVMFAPGWENAYGCRVERMICGLYGIPFIDNIQSDRIRPLNK